MATNADDLSPAEQAVLRDLLEHGRDRVRNIAERQDMHRVTASRALDELESFGLVRDAGLVASVYEATADAQSVLSVEDAGSE
jgi:DNA-binding Lrp family transcriptional regulator